MAKIVTLCFLLVSFFSSCNEYTPRPKGYIRIEREEAGMVRLERPEFSFLYPSNAKIEYLKPEAKHEVWFNILYPVYKATIYCTYIPTDRQKLPKMLDDSHQLAYSHAARAGSITQTQFAGSGNTTGLIYDISGSVASPVQFYITDNTSKFLRGALYFNEAVSPDSVAPVVAFLRSDITHIMESLEWQNIVK
ncbi:hypothetical protein D0T84_02785 [Dysgonomonas sp. 521]|uniref:gliding motility lipoprotein GldD n=1 Tax=Dysgonomonas sp. 521 TaxID=2302932 RepID=UPI0013D208BE|nr:hypothetical protein [Dysgonomonas sp. 521]NDV93844.1 hypothetical protein [Dysgonomonas sp. 521]